MNNKRLVTLSDNAFPLIRNDASLPVIKERDDNQNFGAIHGHNVTNHLIHKIPCDAISKGALLCDSIKRIPFLTIELIRIWMILHCKSQLLYYRRRNEVLLTTTIQNSSQHLLLHLHPESKETLPISTFFLGVNQN